MNYGKARKKPVEIDWFEWDKNRENELITWVKSFGQDIDEHFLLFLTRGTLLQVKTIEGTSYDVPHGYIIIRGVAGEYYPCNTEIFKATYNIE
jgi:hypothetical protein